MAINEAQRREKEPELSQLVTLLDGNGREYQACRVEDDTDYIAKDGVFYPGAQVCSLDRKGETYSCVSAVVLVKKGTERRLTTAFHNWEQHAKKEPTLFGKSSPEARELFCAVQGDPGTKFGYLPIRIGQTDIGLIKMNDGIMFKNRFMEFEASAKKFLKTKNINLHDQFPLDSYSIGK